MTMQAACALLTAVQHRAAAVLKDTRPATRRAPDSPLLKLLKGKEELPDITIFDLAGLQGRLSLDGLLDTIGTGAPSGVGSGLGNVVSLDVSKLDLGNLRDFGQKLLQGDPIAAVRDQIDDLHRKLDAETLSDTIQGIVRRQVGIGISFVTTLTNLVTPRLADRILDGWKQYFFGETGYQTVDGIEIVAPGHSGLLASLQPLELSPKGFQQSLNGLRGLLSERSAEQYVRDLIRIIVEVGGDQQFQLPARLKKLQALVPNRAKKAQRWFKGAASMAESLVTSAVEEATLGVAQFQTNPVLAAAAATYAGTAARKATQHVFLAEATVGV